MNDTDMKSLSAELQRCCYRRDIFETYFFICLRYCITSILIAFLEIFAPLFLHAQFPTDGLTFPQSQITIHLDDKPLRVVTTVDIAGRIYIEPIALAEALDCGLRTEGTVAVLILPSHVLAFAVDANCVALQALRSDTVSIGQMLHPVALQAGRILLPFDGVLRLLADNGVFEVDEREADVYLQSYMPQTISPPQEAPQRPEAQRSETPQTTEAKEHRPSTEQPAPATKHFRKPTRNLYILPNDVQRREMDSLPPKTSSLLPLPQRHIHSRYSTALLLGGGFGLASVRVSAQAAKNNSAKKNNTSPAKTTDKKKSAKPSANTSAQLQEDNDFSSAKKKWALDVIVLDAGHGGKDAGTIGYGKTKEKDVALGIVKRLGILLKRELHGTKIIYTRTDDTFVELDRRGQIANENGGKLFVSIHCNSTPKKPSKANGFEVYILRPGRNDDAVRVAEMENAVIKLEDNPKRYKPLTDEQFIVVSMAQSAFVKYSDMVAAMISAEVKKLREIGVRGVNQAGFLVLVGASMPNMLIETGFLSNKKDEQFLKSVRGQTLIAASICRAIKAYRSRYEAQITGQAPTATIPEQGTKTSAAKVNTTKTSSPQAGYSRKKTTSAQQLSSKTPAKPSPTSKPSHK